MCRVDLPGYSSPLSPAQASADRLPIISCVSCGLIPRADWDGVPGAAISLIESRKSVRREDKGTVLFQQGDPPEYLYRLLAGIVLLRKVDHEGNGIATHLIVPGETFGFRAFVEDSPHTVTAQCASDVVVCRVPVSVARQTFSANLALKRVFARHVAVELRHAEDALLGMADLPVRERILRIFVRFARLFGTKDENGVCRFPLPVLRSDIAALTGIARESFSRRISGIEAEGLLRLDGNMVAIDDLDRVEEVLASSR